MEWLSDLRLAGEGIGDWDEGEGEDGAEGI